MAPLVSRDGCCFDLMHIKTATYIVGAVELTYGILGVIIAILSLAGVDHRYGIALATKILFAIWIGIWILFIVCTIMLFYGLLNNKPIWIRVHLIASLVLIVFVIVYSIYVAVTHFWWNLIFFLIFLIEMLFLIFVEYRCYRYMRKFT